MKYVKKMNGMFKFFGHIIRRDYLEAITKIIILWKLEIPNVKNKKIRKKISYICIEMDELVKGRT